MSRLRRVEDHLCVFADAVSLARSGHTPAAPDETKTHTLPLFLTPRIHMTDWRFLLSIRTHPKSEDDRAKTCVSEPRMHAGPDMVKRSPASSFPSEIKSDDALLVMWPMGLVSWTSWTGVPGDDHGGRQCGGGEDRELEEVCDSWRCVLV